MTYKLNKNTNILMTKINKKTPNENDIYKDLVLKKYTLKKDLTFDKIFNPEDFLENSAKFPGYSKFLNESKNIDILNINNYVALKYDDYLIFTLDVNLKLENGESFKKTKKKYNLINVVNESSISFN